jgi:hypothetical protein
VVGARAANIGARPAVIFNSTIAENWAAAAFERGRDKSQRWCSRFADSHPTSYLQRAAADGYQTYAPLATMFHVRTAGQFAHNQQEFRLFREAKQPRMAIYTSVFQFCNPDPPLSWHLKPSQVQMLNTQWTQGRINLEWQRVERFLAGTSVRALPLAYKSSPRRWLSETPGTPDNGELSIPSPLGVEARVAGNDGLGSPTS